MAHRVRPPFFKRLASLLGIAATLLALALLARGRFSECLARYWRWQLESVPGSQVEQTASHLAHLGDAGLPLLVDALGSARPRVAESAKTVLFAQVERWQPGDSAEHQAKLRILAEALANRADQLPSSANRTVSRLILKILSSTKLPGFNQQGQCTDPQLLSHCERALRAIAGRRGQSAQAVNANTSDDPPSVQVDSSYSLVRYELPAISTNDAFLQLPGGGLPMELANGLATEVEDERLEARPPTATNRTDHAIQSSSGIIDSVDEMNRPPDSMPVAPEPRRLSEFPHSTLRQPSPYVARIGVIQADDSSEVETIQWMHALNDADPGMARRAEEELARRGFGALQLELARQVTSDDIDVRRQLAQHLPRLPGIEARTWLIWLSRDEQPDVRLAALTVMATTGDPEILRRVEEMAHNDDDPRIQQQGELLLRLRRAERGR